jgi:enoyl-CoA hydratase
MPSSFPDRDRPVGSVLPVTVRIDRAGPVWTVLIDRPEARNAVDGPTAQALADAFREFDADPTAAVAVLAGAGGTFCAGADLKAMSNRLSSDMTDDGPMGPSRMELGKPVIAAIGGHAVAGGLELAAWCDLRVMEADAVIGVFCRRWGVPLIDGGTVRLPRIVGLGRALDLILTGRPVGAEEALAMGFANRVVAPRRGPGGGRGARGRAGPVPAGLPALGPPVGVRRVRPGRGGRARRGVRPRRGLPGGRRGGRRRAVPRRGRPARAVRVLTGYPAPVTRRPAAR